MKLRILSGLFAMLPAAAALAHDFWIEPSAWRPAVGDQVELVLRVGEDFSGTSQPYIPEWFSDYRVVGPDTQRPIGAMIGDDPAGKFRIDAAGTHTIGYRSTRAFVEMGPQKFDSYLRDEGLEHVIEARQRDGEADQPAREFYSRCAKAIVHSGQRPPDAPLPQLGYTLELLAERNPYALRAGDTLPVRLLYEGEPLAGALVVAFTSDSPERSTSRRTGADGRVQLDLTSAGIWLIKAVHIIRPRPGTDRADWESFWASLTFELSADAQARSSSSSIDQSIRFTGTVLDDREPSALVQLSRRLR